MAMAGATTLTIMTDSGPEMLEMAEGMITVVPQGLWHRFNALQQETGQPYCQLSMTLAASVD